MTTKVSASVISSAVIQNLFPTGGLMMWPSNSAPSGFLLCDGSTVSRTTYSALFAIVGTTFGSGDGSATFTLPNYTNRFPVGAGSSYNIGSPGGSADAILVSHSHTGTTSSTSVDHSHTFSGTTSGQSVSHTHTATVTDPGHAHTYTFRTELAVQSGSATPCWAGTTTTNTGTATTGITVANGNASSDHNHTYSGTTSGQSTSHTHTFTTSTEGVSGTNANLPPYLGIRFIIKT